MNGMIQCTNEAVQILASNTAPVYFNIVEGKKLTDEIAKEWVESMNPPAKWTKADTDKVKNSENILIPSTDFYVLMNMMYSDFHDVIGEDLMKYIKLSLDWYNDADINMPGSEKLYCYWKNIVRKKV